MHTLNIYPPPSEPTVQFKATSYQVKESDGAMDAILVRSGDLSQRTTVTCYTRQDSALVEKDFLERPRTMQSQVTFESGESSKTCSVVIIDDNAYERLNYFRLVLGDISVGSSVGTVNKTIVEIVDDEDSMY